MTQYVGCEHARTLLEGLIDGELSMADQLAVESHLRWCDTCERRVEDMRLIGASLRVQGAARPLDTPTDAELTQLNESLLFRLRTERAQSLPFRLREMFADMRFLWPAMGATIAVVVCVMAAYNVLHASTVQDPDSLAAMISALGSPGSEKNPLRPADNGITIPRLPDIEATRAGDSVELMPDDDVIYTFRTVVSRDGSLADFEVLLSNEDRSAKRWSATRARREQAILDTVRNTRFLPAQTPLGHAVAVDMVWVIAKTTAVVAPSRPDARVKEVAKPVVQPGMPPVSNRSEMPRASSTA